ncbi:MAG: MipA/OmpV family protein [Oceanospirillaceae bacterium]|nr:MipA/OmpV family protein [Oceanospirillaceae bacterium]
MKTRSVICSLATTALLTSTLANANDNAVFEIGAVAVNGSSIYTGVESTSAVMPSISYKSDILSVSVQEGFVYQLSNDGALKLSGAIVPNFRPYKSTASATLAGMTRNMYFDASLSASFTLARGLDAKLSMATELTNRFNGKAIDASISQFVPIMGQPVIFGAGLKYQDASRANYLYGVKASEATGQRAQYDTGSATSTYLTMSTFHSFTQQTSLFASVNASFLPSNVSNSPIVSNKRTVSSVIGLSYSF